VRGSREPALGSPTALRSALVTTGGLTGTAGRRALRTMQTQVLARTPGALREFCAPVLRRRHPAGGCVRSVWQRGPPRGGAAVSFAFSLRLDVGARVCGRRACSTRSRVATSSRPTACQRRLSGVMARIRTEHRCSCGRLWPRACLPHTCCASHEDQAYGMRARAPGRARRGCRRGVAWGRVVVAR
jgi:hypothetical protein